MSSVTIVIPYFNRVSLFERLINSVDLQTVKPFEVIVVDNGSSDCDITQLWDLIKTRKSLNIKLVSTLKRGSANYARNLGFYLAETNFVAYLDSDDWWEPIHLEKSIHVLNSSNCICSFSGQITHYKNSRISEKLYFGQLRDALIHTIFVAGYKIQTSGLVVRKDFPLIASWDESLYRHQDYDYILTISNIGDLISTGYHTVNLDRISLTSGRNFHFKSMIRFLNKWRTEFDDHSMFKYLISQIIIVCIVAAPRRYFDYYSLMLINHINIKALKFLYPGYYFVKALVWLKMVIK